MQDHCGVKMAFLFADNEYHSSFKKVKSLAKWSLDNSIFSLGTFERNLVEKVLEIEDIIVSVDFDSVCFLVQEMPVYNLKDGLINLFYNYKAIEIRGDLDALRHILENTYTILFAYIQEYRLKEIDINSSKAAKLENYIDFGFWDLHNFKFAKDKINYACNHLVFEVMREKYRSSKFHLVDEKSEKIQEILSTVELWDKKLNEREEKVDKLEKRLHKTESAYDFVLLNKGFKNLYEKKENELKIPENNYKWLFRFIVAIPVLELVLFSFLIIKQVTINPISIWYLIVPSITLILFLFYFYRINLVEIRSIKSQMMQLELRMTLCQFIHNYAENSEILHKKNKEGFEKFENIIFSPIVSSDDKIPSTLDGVEQIAKLIEAIKK